MGILAGEHRLSVRRACRIARLARAVYYAPPPPVYYYEPAPPPVYYAPAPSVSLQFRL